MFSPKDLETILSSLPDPAFVITRSGLYAAVYGGLDSRYYHDGSPLIGLNVLSFMEEPAAHWLIEQVRYALTADRMYIVEYALSGHDISKLDQIGPTETLWFEARIRPLPFKVEGEDAVLWVASNITHRHRLETDLRRLSQTDPLTGLWNRRPFERFAHEDFHAAQQAGRSLSTLMIDIDHFKRINDAFGHPVGDKVLIELATILAQHLKDGDMAARWGGEEFLILIIDFQLAQAAQVAERIRRAVEEQVFVQGVRTTISIGISASNSEAITFAGLVTQADDALYAAKAAGRNCVRLARNLSRPASEAEPIDAGPDAGQRPRRATG